MIRTSALAALALLAACGEQDQERAADNNLNSQAPGAVAPATSSAEAAAATDQQEAAANATNGH